MYRIARPRSKRRSVKSPLMRIHFDKRDDDDGVEDSDSDDDSDDESKTETTSTISAKSTAVTSSRTSTILSSTATALPNFSPTSTLPTLITSTIASRSSSTFTSRTQVSSRLSSTSIWPTPLAQTAGTTSGAPRPVSTIDVTVSPQQNGVESSPSSKTEKIHVPVIVVAVVAFTAFLLAIAALLIRRHYRKKRGSPPQVKEPSASYGPYYRFDKESKSPPQPRSHRILGVWHESRLWGTNSSERTASVTAPESSVYSSKGQWQQRARTMLSINSIWESNYVPRGNQDAWSDSEKAKARLQPLPPIPGTMHSDGASHEIFAHQNSQQSELTHAKSVYLPKKLGNPKPIYPNNDAMLRGLEEKAEAALQRELERQGFGGTSRVATDSFTDMSRYSQATTEPPRWRTAVSWVRDQGDRLNRLSFVSKATSRS